MLDIKSQMTIDLERHWWKYAGAKEQAVREKFDFEPATGH